MFISGCFLPEHNFLVICFLHVCEARPRVERRLLIAYLIPRVKFLMSRPASPLRALLLEQVQGRMLLATAANVRFQHEFCTDGIVLGSSGQILFAGEILNAIQWADDNLASTNESEFEENDFDVNFNLMNSETAGDGIDDLEAWG